MGKRRRARKIRTSQEFDLDRLSRELAAPVHTSTSLIWTLPQIRDARDSQMRGNFRLPAQLAASMRTDDALFTAHENRLAPQRALGVELKAANDTTRARAVRDEGADMFGVDGVGIRAGALSDINSDLANHGVAIGHVVTTPRADGRRVDFEMAYWPIEFVRWESVSRYLMTQVERVNEADAEAHPDIRRRGASEIPIIHGDGRWIVFQKHEYEPWRQEACILPGALIWARHAHAIRDWSKGSRAHGNAKVVGEMPEGVALTDDAGNLTVHASSFLTLLNAIASLDSPAGIKPAGADVDYIVNNSTAWQVWNELTQNAERAAARVYLGTDGTLGAQGGAPGVNIETLFGVATTKIQGDLEAIERGLLTGLIEPWTAVNFGDSSLAPKRLYLIPDADADADRASFATRMLALHSNIREMQELGLVVNEVGLNVLAAKYDVPAPVLEVSTPAPAAEVAPADGDTPPLALVPDPPAVAEPVAASFAERNAAFLADLKDYKETDLEVTDTTIRTLAEKHDVPVPRRAQ